jgi:REP element-mobilizing transposase RayT
MSSQPGLLPSRKPLPYGTPPQVESGSLFFVTVCCAPRGQNQLCKLDVAAGIFESIQYRQSTRQWNARLVVLMPDHLHALIAFPADERMATTIRGWKGFLARQHGIRWQREFIERRIPKEESWQEKAAYIRENPVRLGLIEDTKAWPYKWEI